MTKAGATTTRPNSTTGARNTSDDAVRKATGCTWEKWFAAFDYAGAAKLDHKSIVAIAGELGAGPWWRQMLAVEYEQARGLRKKHEKTDGYQVSRAKTIDVPIGELYASCADAKRRAQWLPKTKLVVHKATANKSLRCTWTDGEKTVEFMFYVKGPSKAQVTVQHSRLADARAAERMKKFWGDALDRLAATFRR